MCSERLFLWTGFKKTLFLNKPTVLLRGPTLLYLLKSGRSLRYRLSMIRSYIVFALCLRAAGLSWSVFLEQYSNLRGLTCLRQMAFHYFVSNGNLYGCDANIFILFTFNDCDVLLLVGVFLADLACALALITQFFFPSSTSILRAGCAEFQPQLNRCFNKILTKRKGISTV